MAKNTVQFQKSMSLPQFHAKYGTEPQCRVALYAWRWPSGFVCPGCGHGGHDTLHSRPLWQCRSCRQQVSLTSGTLFAGSKLPLTRWFLAMYLIGQAKTGLSALELKRQLGVSYNTAWLVKHKLMQAMKERDDGKVLAGRIPLDDAYWGGARSGGKRGRGAAAKTPFVAAVACDEGGHPQRLRMTCVRGFRRKEIAA